MFNKKLKERVRLLELEMEALDNKNRDLTKKVAVLEFKEKAKGNKYVIDKYVKHHMFGIVPIHDYSISYLYNDKVHTLKTDCEATEMKINGDYVEAYKNDKLVKVYQGCDDEAKIEEVDIELYKKAYPDKIKVENKNPLAKLVVDTTELTNVAQSTTDAIKNLTKELKKQNEKADSENKDSADEGKTSDAE